MNRIDLAGVLLGFLAVASLGNAGRQPGEPNGRASQIVGPQTGFDHEHQSWTAILAQYASNGSVDYAGLADRGQPALDAYLMALSAASPDESPWTREERLAF